MTTDNNMASTNFTYSPTSGNGNTNVSVSVSGQNSGVSDKVSTITFSGGGGNKSVTLTQKYKPYITQGSTSIPSSGGSITVSAMTEYDIVFRSVPTWITISSGNTTYTEGQRIAVSSMGLMPAVFTLTAAPNTGESRTIQYEGMNMSHYIGNTLVTTGAPTIEGYQEAGSGPTPLDEWTLDNNSNYNIYGTMLYYQGGTSGTLGIEIMSGEEETQETLTPITIDDIAVVISPLPYNYQNLDIFFHGPGVGQELGIIICTYDSTASAWRGVGTIEVSEGDTVSITVVERVGTSGTNEANTEETQEEPETE